MDEKTELTPTEARGGSRGGTVRVMLVIGLVLVIVAFIAVYMSFG
jgi:flagellar basal body-associated protein FliL